MRARYVGLVLCGVVGLAGCGRREPAGTAAQCARPAADDPQVRQSAATSPPRAVLTHSVFEQALSTMTDESGAEGISPAALHALLSSLRTDEAVPAATRAVICNWCRDYTGAYEVVRGLLQRPLTQWQSNTVHQLLCMLDMRAKRFEAVVTYITELHPSGFTCETPKAMELLRLLETACRVCGDEKGARAALDLQVQLAKQRGVKSVAGQYVLARRARQEGQPWEHLNPELAAFEREVQRQYATHRAQVQDEIRGMRAERRSELRRRYEAFQASPDVPRKNKEAVSNLLFEVLSQAP